MLLSQHLLPPPRAPVLWLATRRPAIVMSDEQQPAEQEAKPLLQSLADASWDMFVMPGEHANSRYDRPIEPLETPAEASTFDWGGGEDDPALRLPTGIKAAERLSAPTSPPRRLWFEVAGRDVAGDMEALSSAWTRASLLAAAFVLLLALVQGGLPTPGLPAMAPTASRSLRQDQDRFIREKIEERAMLERKEEMKSAVGTPLYDSLE